MNGQHSLTFAQLPLAFLRALWAKMSPMRGHIGIAVLGLILAGCGGGSGSVTPSTSPVPAPTPESLATALLAARIRVVVTALLSQVAECASGGCAYIMDRLRIRRASPTGEGRTVARQGTAMVDGTGNLCGIQESYALSVGKAGDVFFGDVGTLRSASRIVLRN